MLNQGGAWLARHLGDRRILRVLFPALFGFVGLFFVLHTNAAAPGAGKLWKHGSHTEPQPSRIEEKAEEKSIPQPPKPPGPETVNPLAGLQLYTDPNSRPRVQADAWRATRAADAAQMSKIASVPAAIWFGDWSGNIQHSVNKVMTAAADQTPILVVYNIPQRDCGSYSSGGTSSPAAYKQWVQSFAAGLAGRSAIVIIEPDGSALTRCLSGATLQTRFELLSYAVTTIKAQAGARVYIDAGNAHWLAVDDIASRLNQAGIAHADGFALNVSNFATTPESTAYGVKVAEKVGKGFVIDTSRNGRGPTPDHQWCNPAGRALGDRSTVVSGVAWLHAYLWIKLPGESDGSCNGAPEAGEWWPEYALGLAQRASY